METRPMVPCRIDHFSLAVSDIDAAIAFFEKGFGYEVAFIERGMSDQIAAMLGQDGARCDLVQLAGAAGPKLELIAFHPTAASEPGTRPTAPGMGHVAFLDADFDRRLDRLVALGARPLGRVTAFEAGRSVYLATPFGAFIELEEAADDLSSDSAAPHA